MLNRILLVIAIFIQIVVANAQLNISLLANYPYSVARGELNDIWGYVDGAGNEYAIVGMEDGVSIMDLSDPTNPIEVFYTQGTFNVWRDIKVWQDVAYITNEGTGGLMIIDLSSLPGTITSADVYSYTGSIYPFFKAHDFFIDENGIGYIIGANNGVGGAIILDLTTNPLIPIELGRYDDYYLHDAMVRGDTLWGAAIGDGFFVVVDVSDKANPVTMVTQNTPNNFTHNCWISDDGQTLFTTDEKSNGFVTSYDVSDLSNISELDRIQSSPGNLIIPHNTFFINDYLVTSYYTDGVVIHDVSNPSNMVEVGNYDTSPAFSGDGYNGCWGVYPYLPSGIIIASDGETGLYVLDPTYTSASYINGNVTDSVTGFSLDSVQVDILTTSVSTNTNSLGNYQTGIATTGVAELNYSKSGYMSKKVSTVLTAGTTSTVNVELKPIVPFTMRMQVVEASSLNPIANTDVTIKSLLFDTTLQTDVGGNISIPNFMEDNYEVYIAKWGYEQLCLLSYHFNTTGNTVTFEMYDGYKDDFRFNLGWLVSGDATFGSWEKATPVGFTGSLTSPFFDSPMDCDEEAFVTRNGGNGTSLFDVGFGETILTSPMFDLSNYNDPYINFDRWFYNYSASSIPNDSMVVELSNGTTIVQLDFADVNDPDSNRWVSKSIQASPLITPTSTMQLIVRVWDNSPNEIVEAGFDNFKVVDNNPVGITDVSSKDVLTIYPNPFNTEINISFNNKEMENVRIEVLDLAGRLIDQKEFQNASVVRLKNDYKQGIYFIKVYGNGKLIKTEKVIKF